MCLSLFETTIFVLGLPIWTNLTEKNHISICISVKERQLDHFLTFLQIKVAHAVYSVNVASTQGENSESTFFGYGTFNLMKCIIGKSLQLYEEKGKYVCMHVKMQHSYIGFEHFKLRKILIQTPYCKLEFVFSHYRVKCSGSWM